MLESVLALQMFDMSDSISVVFSAHTNETVATLSPSASGCRPQFRRDYPLNLSILIRGGKETNKDSLSSGERTGRSPALNPPGLARREM